MKNIFIAFLFLIFLSTQSFAQKDKYKMIQGLGYLHTQVTMLIVHWEKHPLNHKPVDDHEAMLQEHIITEMEHDEEWAEYMMVENNLSHFEHVLDDKIKKSINQALEFYHYVISHLRKPEEVKIQYDDWKKKLAETETLLFEVIYPALCK